MLFYDAKFDKFVNLIYSTNKKTRRRLAKLADIVTTAILT